jgi:hypothetical protein
MEQLEKELIRLRRGRGVMSADLQERLGPLLCTLAGIDAEESLLEARRRLIRVLDELAVGLPEDLRTAFAAALALHEEVQHRFLEERMQWLAARLRRDIKTARRRADEAIRIAAASGWVTSASDAADRYPRGDWYLANLRTVLRLDVTQPFAVEERTVVAACDDLAEIILSTGIPRPAGMTEGEQGADVAVLYGGTLGKAEWSTASYLTYAIRLGHPLCRGDSCEVGVRITVPAGQPFNPRYAFQPLRRCEEFDLRIRFGESAAARRVWRISGLPRGMIEDFAAPEALIVPAAGDIHLNFKHPEVGFVYGARWAT